MLPQFPGIVSKETCLIILCPWIEQAGELLTYQYDTIMLDDSVRTSIQNFK